MIAWVAALLVLTGLCAWGLHKVSGPSGFFAASRSAGAVVAGLGGTAAGLSAFVFVGGPGLFATIGVASLWLVLSAPLSGALQCWVVGERIVDLVRRHDCLTLPDVVAARFGAGWPAGLTAAAVVTGCVATLAVQIAGCRVLGATLLHVPGWWVALGAVTATTAYATAGGMRLGILVEAAQGVIMAVTAIWLASAALAAAGGPAAAVATVARHRPELLSPFTASGGTAAWGLFLLFGLGTCAQPHYLQKFLLLESRRALRRLPAVMTGALLAVLTVWLGVGLGGTALWLEGRIELSHPDQLAPAVVATLGRAELQIVIATAVLAAVMSTAASLLNLAAAALTRDLPRALGRRPTDRLLGPRAATVAVAVGATLLGLASDRPVALLGVLGWGTFTAALLPVMVVGLAWPAATRSGAVCALVVGPVVQLSLELGPADVLPGTWEPALTGAAVGSLALVAVSLARRRPAEQAA